MKTLIISSSLSPDSKSFILCKEIEKRLLKKDIEVKLVDARNLNLTPTHINNSKKMNQLSEDVKNTDNIIFAMGVHNYSINDSLKIILENCCSGAEKKFFAILCAAGGDRSYLSTMHLTQICMNEYRMIQLPRIVYATYSDFQGKNLINKDVIDRLDIFVDEFTTIGNKLL